MLLRSIFSEVSRRIRAHQGVRAGAGYSSSITRLGEKKTITINWKNRDGSVLSTPAEVGSNILRVAHKNDIELEGACEGVCACSTCHVILDQDVYDELPEASEDEEDMLGTFAYVNISFIFRGS
jgi:ferredoxin